VLLSQSRVLYEFSDPKLERLSAGQKILLRMGRENALRACEKIIGQASAPVRLSFYG
jgi:hypothetical protein